MFRNIICNLQVYPDYLGYVVVVGVVELLYLIGGACNFWLYGNPAAFLPALCVGGTYFLCLYLLWHFRPLHRRAAPK